MQAAAGVSCSCYPSVAQRSSVDDNQVIASAAAYLQPPACPVCAPELTHWHMHNNTCTASVLLGWFSEREWLTTALTPYRSDWRRVFPIIIDLRKTLKDTSIPMVIYFVTCIGSFGLRQTKLVVLLFLLLIACTGTDNQTRITRRQTINTTNYRKNTIKVALVTSTKHTHKKTRLMWRTDRVWFSRLSWHLTK